MTGRPPAEVLGEVAYIAYHFHWARDAVMAMPHLERRHWVAEISAINERLNAREDTEEVTAWP